MSKIITIKEIEKEFGISRATFYQQYKDFVIQIPSLTKESIFDYQSVKKRHNDRNTLKQNKKNVNARVN